MFWLLDAVVGEAFRFASNGLTRFASPHGYFGRERTHRVAEECISDYDDGTALNQKRKNQKSAPGRMYSRWTRHSACGVPSWRTRRAHHIVVLRHMLCDGAWDRQVWTPLVADAAKLPPDWIQRCAAIQYSRVYYVTCHCLVLGVRTCPRCVRGFPVTAVYRLVLSTYWHANIDVRV